MRRYSPLLSILVFAAFPASPAHAQFKLLKKLGLTGGQEATSLAEDEIRVGLKEALIVGIDKTIALSGKKDGCNLNEKKMWYSYCRH